MPVEIRDKMTNRLIEAHEIAEGMSLFNWLDANVDDFEECDTPPISISVRGQTIPPQDWRFTYADGQTFIIYPEPKAVIGALIIKAIIGAAISYAITSLTTPKLNNNYASTVPAGSSIYSANAQGNSARLNGIIPEVFGTHKVFPDVLSAPYRYFENDEQWLVLLLCWGVGEYDLSHIRIGQTPIDRYAGDYTLTKFEPNSVLGAAFSQHLYTSLEVGDGSGMTGAELENNGTADYYGPFLACPVNETTDTLFLDFTNSGLAVVNSSGGLQNKTITLTIEWKDINATTWITQNFTRTAATTDQLGETVEIPLGAAITPEVRVKRITANANNTTTYDTMHWTGLKSVIGQTTQYEGVTVSGLIIKGSNTLSSSAENRFNGIAKRKIVGGESGGVANWNTPNNGRGIANAYYYILKDAGRPDSKINLVTRDAMNRLWNWRRDYFDGVFSDETTLYEALQRVLSVGYGYPTILDGQHDIIREGLHRTHDQMFTPDNTLSITENGILLDPDEPDGVRVEYFSEETWKPETVDYLYGTELGIRAEEIRAFGITNKTAAWRFGARHRRSRRLIRRTWEIETELEGLNCNIGHKALILGRGGQHGWVVDYALNSSNSSMWLKLNAPVEWVPGGYHYIALRRPDGTTHSQQHCIDPGGDYDVRIIGVIPDFLPVIDGSMDYTLFQFGTAEQIHHAATIKTIEPQGDTVRIELAEYRDDLYADDFNSPP